MKLHSKGSLQNFSCAGLALPAGRSQFFPDAAWLVACCLRGVQTVLSSPQPVTIFLSALPDVIHASDHGDFAVIHQDVLHVVRDGAHHDPCFQTEYAGHCCPLWSLLIAEHSVLSSARRTPALFAWCRHPSSLR